MQKITVSFLKNKYENDEFFIFIIHGRRVLFLSLSLSFGLSFSLLNIANKILMFGI